MLKQQHKLQCLLSLILSLVGFGIALPLIALDFNVVARIAGLLAAFLSGWGCCYSLGVMSGGIAVQSK